VIFYRLFTWAIDYSLVLGTLFVADSMFAGSTPGRSTEKLTITRHLIFVHAFMAMATSRDFFYMFTFPATIISRFKSQSHPVKPVGEVLFDIVKSCGLLGAVMSNLVLVGASYWTPIFVDNLSDTATNIFWRIIEGYAIWVCKDIVSMTVLHWVLHWPRFYSWHKYHHSITKEMSQVYGGNFDVLDLMLENASGTALLMPIRYLLFGDSSFHMASYIMVFWLDFTSHSANPFTATFVNPVLDSIFLPNLCHNLHHAVINDYFNLVPLGHLLPWKRQKDIQRYNEVFETALPVY